MYSCSLVLWPEIYLVCFHIMALHSKDHRFSTESRWNCCHGLTVDEGFGGFVIPLCTNSFHWYFWSCLWQREHQLCCCHFIANLQIWRQACPPLPLSKLLFSFWSFMWSLLTSSIRISGSVCHVPLGFCCIYKVSEVILERIQDQFCIC